MNTTKRMPQGTTEKLLSIAEKRPISAIAKEIKKDWGDKINYAAKPYLNSMLSLNNINEYDLNESASSIITYFLSNASSYRGDTAKKLKAELKEILKENRN